MPFVGAISGRNYNNVYNCYVTGKINVTGSSWTAVGGLVGQFFGKADIENSYNLADINCKNIKSENGEAGISCAGIIGQTGDGEVNIEKCFNRGNITADGGYNSIGVAGICSGTDFNNNGKIKNCYNSGRLEGNSLQGRSIIGGIIGQLLGMEVLYSYNSGNIIVNTEKIEAGGIVGTQNKTVSNVFNIGKIIIKTNSEISAGGITGSGVNNVNIIENAYNVGKINLEENASSEHVGSITGRNSGYTTLKNCYYLKGTYSVDAPGDGQNRGIELQNISDFPSVLNVVNGEGAFKEDTNNINNGYPILNWE